MASLETLIANVVSIRKLIGVYLGVPKLSTRQQAALKVDLDRLDKNLAALAAYQPPVEATHAAEPPGPDETVEPPNFGESKAMSAGLYSDWVAAWAQRTFPEAYRDWPPTVHAVTPQAMHDAAVKDGCLAQVTACGNFTTPDGVLAALGDFSLYTALTSTSTDTGGWNHQVWHMGKLVGEKVGGTDDGLEFAASLNW